MTLDNVVHREVSRYVASNRGVYEFFPSLDSENHTYAVIIVPKDANERPAWAFVMARVVGDFVVIEEDGPPDKTLSQALMVNASIPRDKIILAYKGESLPT